MQQICGEGEKFEIAAKPVFEQIAVNELKDGGVCSIAVDSNRLLLLIRSDKFLYAVGR